MMDMQILAFQTDSTRISTFALAHEGSNRSFADIGIPEGHHTLSHHRKEADKLSKIAKIDAFYARHGSNLSGAKRWLYQHLVRHHAPGPNRWLLAASAAMGALLLLLADVLSRAALAPQELPVGVVTGVLGGLYLFVLLRRGLF